MTQEEAFLQDILANPNDAAPRLVFADWLEERGDPRAPFVRAHPEIYQFISSLKTATAYPALTMQLKSYASAGRADLLFGLSLALSALAQKEQFNQKLPGVITRALEWVERLLALTPGLPDVEGFLRRACPAHRRQLASLLASGQPAEVLLDALERYGEVEEFFELLACLTQEMVLRGEHPAVTGLSQKMRQQGHPLADLPLSLLDIESEVAKWLPRYSGSGTSRPLPFGASAAGMNQPPIATVGFAEVTTPATAAAIRSAVLNWEEESAGQSEARVFRLDRPIAGSGVSGALLRSLGLDSLHGAGDEAIRVAQVRPHDAFNNLFSAASAGGCYNRGLEGAYGRLAAWRSLAGLVGAPVDASIETVASLVRQCAWASPEANSDWFDHVAHDFSLVAVRPDGLSLAVLAATDTD